MRAAPGGRIPSVFLTRRDAASFWESCDSVYPKPASGHGALRDARILASGTTVLCGWRAHAVSQSIGKEQCEPASHAAVRVLQSASPRKHWRSPNTTVLAHRIPARLVSTLHRALFALLPPTRALANPVTMPTDVCMSNCCEKTARRLATEIFKRVGQRACLITHAPRSGCNERDALLIYDPAGARCILTV